MLHLALRIWQYVYCVVKLTNTAKETGYLLLEHAPLRALSQCGNVGALLRVGLSFHSVKASTVQRDCCHEKRTVTPFSRLFKLHSFERIVFK